MQTIDSFRGKYAFLSNFYRAPVRYEGLDYPTVEHAFQAAKASDPTQRRLILVQPTPVLAKKYGKSLDLRPDWEDVKIGIMYRLVRNKFCAPGHGYLAANLVDTAPALLIEGNTWGDTFWGQCRGRGHNHLGKILMRVRDEL